MTQVTWVRGGRRRQGDGATRRAVQAQVRLGCTSPPSCRAGPAACSRRSPCRLLPARLAAGARQLWARWLHLRRCALPVGARLPTAAPAAAVERACPLRSPQLPPARQAGAPRTLGRTHQPEAAPRFAALAVAPASPRERPQVSSAARRRASSARETQARAAHGSYRRRIQHGRAAVQRQTQRRRLAAASLSHSGCLGFAAVTGRGPSFSDQFSNTCCHCIQTA